MITFDGRRPLIKDDLSWKMIFVTTKWKDQKILCSKVPLLLLLLQFDSVDQLLFIIILGLKTLKLCPDWEGVSAEPGNKIFELMDLVEKQFSIISECILSKCSNLFLFLQFFGVKKAYDPCLLSDSLEFLAAFFVVVNIEKLWGNMRRKFCWNVKFLEEYKTRMVL